MKIPKGYGVPFDGPNTLVLGTSAEASANYMGKVQALLAGIPKGSTDRFDVVVAHDDGCPALSGGGYCACDPDVTLQKLEPGAGSL